MSTEAVRFVGIAAGRSLTETSSACCNQIIAARFVTGRLRCSTSPAESGIKNSSVEVKASQQPLPQVLQYHLGDALNNLC
jgi:hypothetical protein